MPCHHRWLGSKLTPTLGPHASRSLRIVGPLKTQSPGCGSKASRTLCSSAYAAPSFQNGMIRSSHCHSSSSS